MSYLLIKSTFKKILAISPTIQGRFYVMPKYMQELNASDLEQTIASAKTPNLKSGPLVAMIPPPAFGSNRSSKGGWTKFLTTLYFLKTSFTDEMGSVISPSPMNTSNNPIEKDWDDMKTVATNTIRLIDLWFGNGNLAKIRLSRNEDVIVPVSLQGNDRRSGVKVTITIDIYEGCEITGYSESDINTLINTEI